MNERQMKEENTTLRLVLSQVQSTFVEGLGEVTQLLSEWRQELKEEFLIALNTKMTNTQEKIKLIITADPTVSQAKFGQCFDFFVIAKESKIKRNGINLIESNGQII
ncbi:hypothetical protein RFI_07224 [Reticulomyxa filosa]|uniref:Uncharacterized protein n=1 Tax=Reticulomyxa filosa TaxID=46433 RepID=X6NUC8_RETFI|nr:hypothetical protein RFI_07224 [Reticulomyxa filosa]|eukprot:ETO29895.1 hypothetical protein RFI_07224 [Reticulomyxa filosa]